MPTLFNVQKTFLSVMAFRFPWCSPFLPTCYTGNRKLQKRIFTTSFRFSVEFSSLELTRTRFGIQTSRRNKSKRYILILHKQKSFMFVPILTVHISIANKVPKTRIECDLVPQSAIASCRSNDGAPKSPQCTSFVHTAISTYWLFCSDAPSLNCQEEQSVQWDTFLDASKKLPQ